jgi:hypothetical protein
MNKKKAIKTPANPKYPEKTANEMSPLKEVTITVEGVAPLQMERMTDADIKQAMNGSSRVMKGEKKSPIDAATERAYLDADGHPYIPADNLYRCIVQAGRHIKYGKSQLTTGKESRVPGFLDLVSEDGIIPVMADGNGGGSAEFKPAIFIPRPSDGGIRPGWRPVFHDWSLTFTLRVDTDFCPVSIVRQLVDFAGRWEGLGPQRPSRKGRYGKFQVVKWEVR